MDHTAATLDGTNRREQETNATFTVQATRKEKGGEDEGSNNLPQKEKSSERGSVNHKQPRRGRMQQRQSTRCWEGGACVGYGAKPEARQAPACPAAWHERSNANHNSCMLQDRKPPDGHRKAQQFEVTWPGCPCASPARFVIVDLQKRFTRSFFFLKNRFTRSLPPLSS